MFFSLSSTRNVGRILLLVFLFIVRSIVRLVGMKYEVMRLPICRCGVLIHPWMDVHNRCNGNICRKHTHIHVHSSFLVELNVHARLT